MKILVFLSLYIVICFSFISDFDKAKIKGYNNTKDIRTIIAPIVNQVFIASKKLSKDELKQIVLAKGNFKILGYDKVYGLLIEIDENNQTQKDILRDIKQIKYIDNIYNRVYEGSLGFKLIKKGIR